MQTFVRILQISDTHLFDNPVHTFYGLNTEASFLATLAHVKSTSFIPHLCLLTGDVSQDSSIKSYQRIAQHIQTLECPTYWLPGNHDEPNTMAQTLEKTSLQPDKFILIKNWQIILLNSHKPRSAAGYLSQTELNFLETQLQRYPDPHALIVLHHQPLHVGSQWLDGVGLENAPEFLAILDRYAHIRGVIFGHVHQESEAYRNNIPFLSTPSTCFQFLPQSTPFALDIDAHPGYRQIELLENGRIKSQIQRIPYLTGRVDPNAAGY